MKASDLFIRALENEGVKYIFGVPGEENFDLLHSLTKSTSISYIPTRHEQGAAFMADVHGRLTGKAACVMATLGPGATNLVTGLADANMDRAPIVAITGQAGTDRQHKESHQFMDIVGLFKPFTKWNTQITTGSVIAEVVRKAFKVAEEEKPGVTHLELPENIAKEDVVDTELVPVIKVRRPSPDHKAIDQAVTLIQAAKQPLILAGNGCIRKLASQRLREFVSRTKIPVAHTFMGKGALSDRDPYSLYSVGLQARDYVQCAFDAADLVITVGYDIVEYDPRKWNPRRDKKIISIDFLPAEVDAYCQPVVNVVGDISQTLASLMNQLKDYEGASQHTEHIRNVMHQDITEYATDESFPIKPQRILSDVRKALGDTDILISDVGAHKLWIARMYPTYEPNTCIISNGFASMGIALPGGIAAKLVYPDRHVLTISGDGGFLMNVQELETAVRLKTPTINMIWNDGQYGMIHWKFLNYIKDDKQSLQNSVFKEQMSFGNPDFVKLAESFGARGMRVTKTSDLPAVIEEAKQSKIPVVIDVPVDYSENIKLTQKLQNVVCAT